MSTMECHHGCAKRLFFLSLRARQPGSTPYVDMMLSGMYRPETRLFKDTLAVPSFWAAGCPHAHGIWAATTF